jgi:regulatory protein
MIITSLERQRRRRRVNVFVDGRFALAVGLDLAAERGLHTGMTLSEADLLALREAEVGQRAYEAGLRLLAYRPRSEREMRQRLARRGFGRPLIDDTVERLRRLGYLDDDAFARYWTESRNHLSPRARRLIQSELRLKGIDSETAAEASAEVCDDDAAYRAAARRLRSLAGLDFPSFRERLGGFLRRRGFSYGVARRTVERCWHEMARPETEGEEGSPSHPAGGRSCASDLP